jgi:hypothetical protein
MALIEDMFKGNVVTGLAIGLGAVLLGPTVLPVIGRALRPVAKAAIKGGMVLYRETFAELGEAASDLVAEARSELAGAGAAAGAMAAGTAHEAAGAAHESAGRGAARGGSRGETH